MLLNPSGGSYVEFVCQVSHYSQNQVVYSKLHRLQTANQAGGPDLIYEAHIGSIGVQGVMLTVTLRSTNLY